MSSKFQLNVCLTIRVLELIPKSREHLYRRHLLPKFVCDRCLESFQNADALKVHHRAQTQCLLRDEPLEGPDGVTPAQENQLRSRKRSRLGGRDTEHEKWESIYTILFPGEPEIPSPCKLASRRRIVLAVDVF